MPTEIENDGERMTVRLKGDIDHHSVTSMRLVIDAALERAEPRLLILDFADVSFMDSSGIGLILGRMRVLSGFGGKIAVKNPSSFVSRMILLSGLSGCLLESNGRCEI